MFGKLGMKNLIFLIIMIKENSHNRELAMVKEDLKDLESYIEEFSNFLPLAVAIVNPVGIIININRAFENLTGFNQIEIIGESLISIFLEKNKIQEAQEKIIKTVRVDIGELTLISKRQKRIPVNICLSQRQDEKGDFIGYFIGIIDISEVKKLKEDLEIKVKERTEELEEKTKELEASRKALMNILEDIEKERKIAEAEKNKTLAIITNFTDGLLVFDDKDKVVLVNPRTEDFFGISARDIIGKIIPDLFSFTLLKPLAQLLSKEIKGIFRKELVIKEDLTLEVSTVPLVRFTVNGEEILGNLVILHDITREKVVERMKTEFVSLAAHQLRTPLSVIKWTLRTLLDGDLGKISQEQRDFIEKTYKSNERMINLINDLLNVTRIEEGRYLFRLSAADIGTIIQFVVNSYKEEAQRRQIEIEIIKPEKKLPEVFIDIEKIRLAVQNLLDNALRYNRPGGKVIISFKNRKGEIEVSIEDTGVGIPKEQHERVFNKFFRAANVMKIDTEGTGLGLFIAKNIIEAHKGRIWFKSEEGKGSTFYFSLPTKNELAEFSEEL